MARTVDLRPQLHRHRRPHDLVRPLQRLCPNQRHRAPSVLISVHKRPVHHLHPHHPVHATLGHVPIAAQLALPREIVHTARVLLHQRREDVAVCNVLHAQHNVQVAHEPRRRCLMQRIQYLLDFRFLERDQSGQHSPPVVVHQCTLDGVSVEHFVGHCHALLRVGHHPLYPIHVAYVPRHPRPINRLPNTILEVLLNQRQPRIHSGRTLRIHARYNLQHLTLGPLDRPEHTVLLAEHELLHPREEARDVLIDVAHVVVPGCEDVEELRLRGEVEPRHGLPRLVEVAVEGEVEHNQVLLECHEGV
mmetsp:Transcript_944/g.2300  ORF Transcript_944/g.2300 Transcript_944/m.2300 type:complete len:304 (+) Transcript_944:1839-2750(+)